VKTGIICLQTQKVPMFVCGLTNLHV